MATKKKAKTDTLVDTLVDVAKDGAAFAGKKVPVISTLVRGIRYARDKRDDRRITKLFLIASDVDGNFEPNDPKVAEAVRIFATSDEDVMAVVNHWLNADEEEKQWFFGALLRAFALGEVGRRSERLRLLKFVDLVVADDLHDFIEIASRAFRMLGKPEMRHAASGAKVGPPGMGDQEPVMLALHQLGLLQGFEPGRDLSGLRPLKPEPDTPMWRLMSICDVARRSREQLAPVLK